MVNQIHKISLGILFFCCWIIPATANIETEERLFQNKSQLVRKTLADSLKFPTKGDRGKYIFPVLIAYRDRYPTSSWKPEHQQQFQVISKKNSNDFYTNSDAFAAPGLTRLLYLFPEDQAVKKLNKNYMSFLFPPVIQSGRYNFWQSGGTENFVNMLRTSGYLLAQKGIKLNLPYATQRLREKEAWLYYKARHTYRMGVAEWDSSTYTIFNLIGWLNLYDFAEDANMKNVAKAVLDYYASAIALKYTYGVYGGAEQRGGGTTTSFNSNTDYLGWLWFSEYIPETSSFFKWPAYIQLIHPATSSYRPPREAILLARKKDNQESYYQNAKANYGLARLEVPELFYIGKTYTLGTALVNNGKQVINWKLVSSPQQSEDAFVVTGSNSYGSKNSKNGMGKTNFDCYVQHRNILAQMTYIPQELQPKFKKQQFRNFISKIINKIPCGNTCKYVLQSKLNNFIPSVTYPVKKVQGKYQVANYISYPKEAKLVPRKGIYFLELNKTYVAISPFPLQENLKPQTTNKRNYLEITAPLGTLGGFILEVGNQFDHQSFDQFQDKIVANIKLDMTQRDSGKIDYLDSEGNEIAINYQFSQAQATWQVNGQKINLNHVKLYQGDNLEVDNQVLQLKSKDSIYQIDYRDKIPIFSRFKTEVNQP
ncbi:MAG: hypothetical protein QNJ65_13415 [Xenococcaceae cyanobacterium MO_234.B1]|nr:hypothetical protein [Xenococcaceae cyanobacterium MO_234.B1]